jgi:large conductance mechanosensitive channel
VKNGFERIFIKSAAGFIIGNAFIDVVAAFTSSFIIPIFGVFGGIPEFKKLTFSINNSLFYHGEFFDSIVNFLIVGFVLYICIILPFSIIQKKLEKTKISPDRECPKCYSKINKMATRCAFCSSDVEPIWTAENNFGKPEFEVNIT